MKERKGLVTFQGNPLTLLGNEIGVGDKAPDVTLTANDMTSVTLSSFKGRVCIISAVPSLDTPVCDTETRRFNEEAGKFGKDTQVITVSMDLPFAQKRWCGAAGIERVKTLSDYKDSSFGNSFGVLIKELKLLARSIFIADCEGIVRYIQLVKEITTEPDYSAVLKAVEEITI